MTFFPFHGSQGFGTTICIAFSACFLCSSPMQAQSFEAVSTQTARGTCLVKKAEKVLDEEPCSRTRQTGRDGKEIRTFYQWPSGSKTVRVERGEEVTLNGKAARKVGSAATDDCVLNTSSGNTFCFVASRKAAQNSKQAAAGPGPQADSCAAYIGDLKRKASAVSVTLSRKQNVSAGEPIGVSISLNGADFSPGTPAYLMVTSVDDVRFKGRGFVPLPGGTPGPANLSFAKEKMRAFTPLHARNIPQEMNYEIKPYREGDFEISWAITANTPCGEKLLTDVTSQKYVITSGPSDIVVQDVYDYSRPNDVIFSNDGRYKLVVFDKYYQVFDRANGTKILDRRGMCPGFSPTSRFVAALSGNLEETCDFNTTGKTQPKFEVVDLVSSETVARVHPPALWAYGDSFLVVKAKWWKMLQGPGGVVSLLSDDVDPDRKFLAEHHDTEDLGFDIDTGLIGVRTYGEKHDVIKVDKVYSMVNGKSWTRSDQPNTEKGEIQDKGIIESVTAIAADTEVLASHQRYFQNAEEVLEHIGNKAQVKELASRKVPHKTGRAEDAVADLGSSERDGRFLTAALTGTTRNPLEKFLLLADDNANRSATSIIGDLLGTRFVSANPATLISKQGEIERISGLNQTNDEEKRALLAAWEEKMLPVIWRDIPDSEKVSKLHLECWPSGDNLGNNISAAWRYEGAGRTVWLVHGNCMAVGTVGGLVINHLSLFITENGKTEHYNLLSDGPSGESDSEGIAPAELLSKGNAVGSFAALTSSSGNVRVWIPHSQPSLIGYKPLHPTFHAGRYLFIPIGRELHVVDLNNRTLSKPIALAQDTAESLFYADEESRNFIHLSSDGRFEIFSLESGESRLKGRYVDDEIVIYDRNGYFLATHEGGQYVHFRFKGRNGLYSLSQFAANLERPDYILQAYREGPGAVPPPKLSAPPRLSVERIKEGEEENTVTLQIDTRSYNGLKELKIFRDGLNVLRRELAGTAFSEKIAVSVPAEARWLSVVATDQNGFESITRKIALELQPASPEGRLFALAVGTDKYDDAKYLGPLSLAVADAKSFLQAAQSAKGRYYSDVVTHELLDAPQLNAELPDTIRGLIAQAGPNDTIMLHIAGHGLRDKQGKFYLAGKSTRIADLPNTAVLWSNIGEILEKARSKVVVFLDACHSGAAGDNATNDDAAAAFLNRNGSIAVIAASKGRQFSEEDATLRGGVFTASLRRALTSDRANTDRNGNDAIELSELYGELKRRVVELTEGRQTPWIARNQLKGEVPLF